jgi:peptidoglycan L-alanyl-D-glutamate endopeptidase CwlK
MSVKKDALTLQRIELLHPSVRQEAKEIYEEICERLNGRVLCRFAFTLRTFAEQDALYAQGRTTKGVKVTNAKGGQSWHNYGLAIDIVMLHDKDDNGTNETASWDNKIDFDGDGVADWLEVVYVFKLYGWEWGGDWTSFKDTPHFQKTFGLTIAEARSRFDNKQLLGVTNYIRL